jgi:ATP-dependent exoDNAse (exonuclease V) alpha subunit
LVWDTKGYDANIVYVINPDGGDQNTIKKRSLFYVAATRAKQFLAVYSSIPEQNSPIMQDALRAVQNLERQLI